MELTDRKRAQEWDGENCPINFYSFYFLGGRRGQLKKEKLKDERPASSSHQCPI